MKKLNPALTILTAMTVLLLVLYLTSNAALNDIRKENTRLNEALLNQKVAYANDLKTLGDKTDGLKKQLDQVTQDYVALSEEHEALLNRLPVLNDFERSLIEKQGVSDPTSIIRDLLNHPELIPYDGVLGGVMMFTDAYLINDKWVFARFEDGHIMGSGLFQYEIKAPFTIYWKLVKAEMY